MESRGEQPGAEQSGLHQDYVSWKTVELKGSACHTCVAVRLGNESVLWQIQPIHTAIRHTPFARWLDPGGRHNNRGADCMQRATHTLCPTMFCTVHRGHRSHQHSGGEAGFFSDMVTTGWLLTYLLRGCVEQRHRWLACARRSYDFLSTLASAATQHTVIKWDSRFGPIEWQGGQVWQDLPAEVLQASDVAGAMSVAEVHCQQQLGHAYQPLSVAGWLWRWSLTTFFCHGTEQSGQCPMPVQGLTQLSQSLTSNALAHLAASLESWAAAVSEATPLAVITTHPRGEKRCRHVAPLLRHHLGRSRNLRQRIRDFRGDGGRAAPSASKTEEAQCELYHAAVHSAFKDVRALG